MMMTDEINIRPREVKGRKIFMTMYSDIDWTQKNNEDICRQNASWVSAYARNCPTGSWTFLGPGDEESGMGLSLRNQMANGTSQQYLWCWNFQRALCQSSDARQRNIQKFWWRESSFQYNAEPQTAELLLGAITAVNTFLQNLYHVSQSTKLWTPKHGETWRRNVMNNWKNLLEGMKQAKCVKTLNSQEPFPRDTSFWPGQRSSCWCNSRSPPQTAEPQMEEGAGRDVPSQLLTRLTLHKTSDIWARRDLMRKRDERLESFPETENSRCRIHKDSCQRTVRCDQVSNCAGRKRHHMLVSRIHASSWRNLKVLEGTNREPYQDWTCSGCLGYRTIWPTQSWDQNWFIDERWITIFSRHQQEWWTVGHGACFRLHRIDTTTLGTARPVAFVPWNVRQGVSSSKQRDGAHISIGQRTWEFIPSVDKVINTCYLVSKKMTSLSRHNEKMREIDGVAAWNKLLPYCEGFLGQTTNWDAQQRTTCLMTCTSKVRFLYCLNQRGQIKYLRALQGQSGRVKVDPTLQNNVKIPYGWTDYINLLGSTWDYRSTVDAGLLAGGNGDNFGRHTCFFTAVNLSCEFDVDHS